MSSYTNRRIKKVIITATAISFLNVYSLGSVEIIPPAAETVQVLKIEPETEVKPPEYLISDVPLTVELQEYTYNTSKKYGVPYKLVLAVMQVESDFDEDAVSETNDYGIMQINEVNHGWLKRAGINPMTTEGNIEAGITMIADLMHYEDWNLIMMAYNMGEAGAQKKWEKGIYSSAYSEKVVQAYKTYILK